MARFLAELMFATGSEDWKQLIKNKMSTSPAPSENVLPNPSLATAVDSSMPSIRSKEFRIAVYVRDDISRGMFVKWTAKNALVSCKFPADQVPKTISTVDAITDELHGNTISVYVLPEKCDMDRFLSWSKLSHIPGTERGIDLVTKQWVFVCLEKSRLVDTCKYVHPLQRSVAPTSVAAQGPGQGHEQGQATQSSAGSAGIVDSSAERDFKFATSVVPMTVAKKTFVAAVPSSSSSSSSCSSSSSDGNLPAIPSGAATTTIVPVTEVDADIGTLIIPENKNEHITSVLSELKDVYAAIKDEWRKVRSRWCLVRYCSDTIDIVSRQNLRSSHLLSY